MSKSNFLANIKEIFIGYAIGAANIIPGVSGGTFLLIFGLYEKVVSILSGLSIDMVKEVVKLKVAILKAPFNKNAYIDLFSYVDSKGFIFLGKLGIGAFTAIITLSSLLEYLIKNRPEPTYGFFFGLIIISIIVPFKLIKKLKLYHSIPFVIGVVVTVWVSASVNPYDKIISKSKHYETKFVSESTVNRSVDSYSIIKYQGIYSFKDYATGALAGAISISAMVLPGISGSLVLILMGKYFTVISAISGAKDLVLDHFLFLAIFALGMGLGLLVFVKIVDYVFKKWHDGTMASLTGLIVGSLWAVWPFKESIIAPILYVKESGVIIKVVDRVVATNVNILPTTVSQTIIVLIAVVVGIAVMIPFVKGKEGE